jgi:CDP-diacylglycerol pyrophosphatase
MKPSTRRIRAAALVPLLAALAGFACGPAAADDQALWRIVDSGCRGGAQASPAGAPPGSGGQALVCDAARGYAVLKDRCGATHYLVVPIARRIGIESPELLRPDEPRYLALAWGQRGRSLGAGAEGGSGAASPADVGLAVNSRYGRSQSQLHVHIDFVRPEVRAALQSLPRPVVPGTRVRLSRHDYRVDPLESLDGNLVEQVAREWGAESEDDRARLTVAVVSDGGAGYFLLSDRADPLELDRGHAEELLIERMCR